MHTRTASILMGALLSTGMIFAQNAQAPDSTQTPAAAQAAPAEGHGHHRHADPDKMAARMAKKLNLSSDQVAQIKPILADRQQQMQSLRADSSLSKDDRHAKAMQIQQDSKTKIEAVLNDTQKQQFEQMLANRRAHRHHHGAGQDSAPAGSANPQG